MIVAIIGFVFSCYQWRKKIQSERAEKLSNLINVLRRDVRQLSVLYKIDYNEPWYDKSFHKSELEGEVDQFLSYYEYILYLKKNHMISRKEFRFFEYDIESIIENYDVQNYLFNLYHFSEPDEKQHAKSPKDPFVYNNILNYAKKKKSLDKSFDNGKLGVYSRHLYLKKREI